MGRIDYADDGRAEVSPNRYRDRLACFRSQCFRDGSNSLNRFKLVQRGQSQLKGRRPQGIATGDCVLTHKPKAPEAHEVWVRTRGGQACLDR